MEIYQASQICMWNCVNENKKDRVFDQLKHLYEIMHETFSGVLFRNTLDYIFSHALLPEGNSPRLVASNFRAIMPRTQEADNILRNNRGFSAARKNIKVEHITSVKTLGLSFQKRDFDFVCKNFNVCIVTNDEYNFLGKGCGHERYGDKIKLLVPREQMIKKREEQY